MNTQAPMTTVREHIRKMISRLPATPSERPMQALTTQVLTTTAAITPALVAAPLMPHTLQPDFGPAASLALQGFVAAGQVALDPFLGSLFVQLVKGELEKAYRLGRLTLADDDNSNDADPAPPQDPPPPPTDFGLSEAERASAYKAGLDRAAEILDYAATLPFDGVPGPDVVRAVATTLRKQAERLR